MSQLAQNNPHLSLYREVGSFLNHLELPTLAKEYRKIEKKDRKVWRLSHIPTQG